MIIIGVDAAWSESHPSGIAVLDIGGSKPALIDVARSYYEFEHCCVRRTIDWTTKPVIGKISLKTLIEVTLARRPSSQIAVIAVDMPLSYQPIIGRRVSDNFLSLRYGSKWASTHTPTAQHPGKISDDFMLEALELGYPLATKNIQPESPCLIEVYPHPAIIELMGLDKRLPYKVAKRKSYNKHHAPPLTVDQEWACLLSAQDRLYDALCMQIDEIDGFINRPSSIIETYGRTAAKPVEDMLDAIICCWVGYCFFKGNIESFGDDTSAIWVPVADTAVAG